METLDQRLRDWSTGLDAEFQYAPTKDPAVFLLQ
jgi:hypothetical protein